MYEHHYYVTLKAIGGNLRAARKIQYPKDTQAQFACRIGVSRVTFQKMEKGDANVRIGSYLEAAALLGLLDGFQCLFEQPRDLFEETGL